MNSTTVRHLNFFDEDEFDSSQGFALNYLWMLAIALFFLLGATTYSLVQKYRITTAQDQLTAVSADLTQLRAQRAKRQQDSISMVARKEVLGDPILWSDLLRKMVQKIPDGVTLSQITGTITAKRTLVIKGISPFVLPIFRLKDNFASLNECARAALVSIEQAQANHGEEQLSFQMECTLS